MPNGNEIIYCGAGTITNYSPLARRAPHDIDLYSITVAGSTTKRLTNFNAYEFSSITPGKKSDTILCKLITKGAAGIFLLSLTDKVITKIEASNNPRPEIGDSFYDTPAFAKGNTQICFTAPYQLYLMNLSDKKCIEIWSTYGKEKQAMPIFARFDGSDQEVLFSVLAIVNRQYSRSAQFFSYDLTTKTLTPILIPIGD